MTPAQYVLLILAGGTAAIGVPVGVVVLLCETHANQTAEQIRQQHARPAPVQRQPQPARKELVS